MNTETECDHRQLNLPGFRFHPTEEELIDFYLKNVVYGKKSKFDIIGYLNIYLHDPWDLPGLSKIGEREWYFFVPRDRKHGAGGRPNRTTDKGFWKATGSDRKIVTLSDPKRFIGLRKTLVFYRGRAPRGNKTDWVMNEYRLPDSSNLPEDIVLCKIYRKATSLKVLEQRAAMEEEIKTTNKNNNVVISPPTSLSSMDSNNNKNNMLICCSQEEDSIPMTATSTAQMPFFHMVFQKVQDHDHSSCVNNIDEIKPIVETNGSSLKLSSVGKGLKLPELQVPKASMDWNPDNFLLNSPWPQCLTPFANVVNF